MKINWLVRFKHKQFLVAFFAAILIFAQSIADLLGVDITVLSQKATDIFNAVLVVLVTIGVVTDPTTASLSDSKQAMTYHEPRDDIEQS